MTTKDYNDIMTMISDYGDICRGRWQDNMLNMTFKYNDICRALTRFITFDSKENV